MKWLFALAFGAILGTTSPASPQTYPSRPITMIVPFPAGGAVDAIGRIITDRMRVSLHQPIIIENVPGAAGSIGVGRVARAAPDGYTLSLGIWSTHVVNGAIYPLQYDPLTDFEPIALVAMNPLVIVAKNAVPAKDMRDLIAWLKRDPGKASLATVGAGSPPHIAGLLVQELTGTRFQFVPYRGGAAAVQDLLAGQVDFSMLQAGIVLTQVREGKLRAYAVTAPSRLPSVPEIPTVDEAGLPGLHVSVWTGLWAPKGTPASIVATLNAAVADALADTGVRQRLVAMAQDIPQPEQQTAKALGVLQRAEIEKWWPIIRAANVKAE
jgi:tripartite-type tricarboxylate transporter receptor subunit TctC